MLRRHARKGKKLSAVAAEALKPEAEVAEKPPRHRDLDDIAGTWVEDAEFDRAIEGQQQVDTRLWRLPS